MAGLLGQNTSGGLLSGLLATNRGATPEALRRRQEEERRAALLAQTPPPAAPQRGRVSGLRVFDAVLGGKTISEGIDADRARLEAEAMRPQQMQRMAQLRGLAESMGPAAMIAFETNPEAFGAQLAEQYAPQVIAAGGVQSVIGSGARVSAPRDMEFGDSLVRTDPLQPAPQTLMQRGPTFAEETGRMTAEKPIELSPGTIALNRDGSQFGQGAPRVFSAGDGVDLVQEGAGRIYSNPKDAPVGAARPQQAVEIEGRLASLQSEVVPVIDRMEGLLRSGDVITGIGAPQRLLAAKARAAMGDESARRQVAATEEYVNTAGRLRVGMAKTLGANPSNADILLLERVTAGDVNQSTEGLLATIRQGRELSTRQQADLQRQLQSFASASPSPEASGGPVTVNSPAEAQALPPGTRYRTPQGQEYIR